MVLGLGTACGGATPHATKTPEQSAAATKKPAEAKSKLPKRCARTVKGECLPPQAWVNRLCDGLYPDVALHMFRPGTPWQRFYMLYRAEPYNASGGMSLLGDKLEPGEEVIALRRRGNDGEFQVGDSSGYDVLRWNGACATVHDGEFSSSRPNSVRHSKLEWKRLSVEVRQALEARPEISSAYDERHRHCKGVTLGVVSSECVEYDNKLMDEIVNYVRTGAKLPEPPKVP